MQTIYLAGGCFWGVEDYFQKTYGVIDVVSGYANGKTNDPTYEAVCYEGTDHAETVAVQYDPAKVSLEYLLYRYYSIIDPTSVNRQGNDHGRQYRTGIYYTSEEQKQLIEQVTATIARQYDRPLAVEIMPLVHFYDAESYHQNYLVKNPGGYCHIHQDAQALFIPSAMYADRKEPLTELQHSIAYDSHTERPFSNDYWDHFAEGIYVDRTNGEPLFFSKDKFSSSCGWPSFSRPIEKRLIREKRDRTFGMERVEVRTATSDIHLGHVFTDGPSELGGLRYCINGEILRFIPRQAMEQEGYGYLIDHLK